MNLMHLKYAVEVDKMHSINKADENLFMGQPNLSRAIKELEEYLGITIFKRTPNGVTPTSRGEEFLTYAKAILQEVNRLEEHYQNVKIAKKSFSFSISVPRLSYASLAFSQFIDSLDGGENFEIYYKETNSLRAINNMMYEDYNLGIIRYQTVFENFFQNMLYDKGLRSKDVWQFASIVLLNKDNPLAKKRELYLDDLNSYIEIAHGDPYVPSMPLVDMKKSELNEGITRRVYVFDKASRFSLLQRKDTFMWSSPLPGEMLEEYGVIQKKCVDFQKDYKDILVYKKEYLFSDMDKRFLDKVTVLLKKIDN